MRFKLQFYHSDTLHRQQHRRADGRGPVQRKGGFSFLRLFPRVLLAFGRQRLNVRNPWASIPQGIYRWPAPLFPTRRFAEVTKLRIHSDPTLSDAGNNVYWLLRPLFMPELKRSAEDESSDFSDRPFRKIVAEYNRRAHTLFELSDLATCDVAVVPVDWEHVRGGNRLAPAYDRDLVRRIRRFAAEARQAGKPVIIFFSSSMSHERVPVEAAFVFRHAMYRSKATTRDLAMPIVIARDIRREFGDEDFAPLPKVSRPKISFCGLARSQRLSERLKSFPYRAYSYFRTGMLVPSPYYGMDLRRRCMSLLSESKRVDTAFTAQQRGVYLVRDKERLSKREAFRRPFVRNILESPYHLSLRGSSNHSFRHWEILCCGRIPVYIDTDCGIPAEDFVDWSGVMLRIDEHDVNRVAEVLADFHDRTSDAELQRIQLAARNVWEEWCTPHGFASNLHRYAEAYFR